MKYGKQSSGNMMGRPPLIGTNIKRLILNCKIIRQIRLNINL